MAADRLAPLPRRLLGLGMVGLVVALLGLCVAVYNKVFTDSVPVTVQIDQVDNSFLPQAEVRMRGVTVGMVDEVTTDGQVATLKLSLDPDKVPRIPRNVTAALLPKSLFGERFVALEPPANPSPQAIQAGDVITRDRSGSAVQTEQLFDNLLPLLQAVQPADLASALGGLNQALQGRGEQLGETITLLHQYLSKFNPALPDLTADLRALPQFTDTYTKAAPDLLEALENLTTTSNTLVEKKTEFARLFSTLTDTSYELRDFLDANGDNIINLASTARPTAELLARYSPEYVCLVNRLADSVDMIDPVFKKGSPRPALHVTVEVAVNRGKYVPHRDEPEFTDNRGPKCYDNTPVFPQYPGGPYQDGDSHPPASPQASQIGGLLGTNNAPGSLPLLGSPGDLGRQSSSAEKPKAGLLDLLPSGPENKPPAAAPASPRVPAGVAAPSDRPVAPVAFSADTQGAPSIANSPPERRLVSGLVADITGTDPAAAPAWSSLLLGPLLRGAEVTVR